MKTTCYTRARVCRGHSDWICQTDYSHAITLNSERQLSIYRAKSIFGTFCARMDKALLNCRRIHSIPSSERLQAIAFPEHLETNAHLHGFIQLRPFLEKGHKEDELEQIVSEAWKKANRYAGSVYLKPRYSSGFDAYAMKDVRGPDPIYFLAADFHPH